MSTTHRVRAALGTVALTGLLLSGCGGGDAGPGAQPSGSSGTPEPSGSGDPTSRTSESAAPASGPAMSNTAYTLRLPEGWTETQHLDDLGNIAAPKGSRDNSTITVELADNYGQATDLDRMVAINLRSSSWARKPERVDDTTLGGLPAYHLSGPSGASSASGGPGPVLDVYGALSQGVTVDIEFELEGTAEERQALIDAVLATWQWR